MIHLKPALVIKHPSNSKKNNHLCPLYAKEYICVVHICRNMTLNFIADPGTNYVGDINKLKELALMSMKAGATHFKPQIYNASDIYKKEDNPYYELQQKCSINLEDVQEINDYCKSIDIIPMFSCFCIGHLRWLEEVGCNLLKISASMAGNKEFISEASNYGFDTIISISPDKSHFSVWDYQDLFKNVKFMYCRTLYPSHIIDYNMEQVRVLEGISDHTDNICLSVAASAVGCKTFERHIHFRWYNTPDIRSSIHTSQFRNMVNVCNEIEKIL